MIFVPGVLVGPASQEPLHGLDLVRLSRTVQGGGPPGISGIDVNARCQQMLDPLSIANLCKWQRCFDFDFIVRLPVNGGA